MLLHAYKKKYLDELHTENIQKFKLTYDQLLQYTDRMNSFLKKDNLTIEQICERLRIILKVYKRLNA